MKPYMEQLQAYIAANPPKYQFCNGESVLELLYCAYMETNPTQNQRILSGVNVLHRYTNDLTPKEKEIVFDTIYDLCGEYEHRAFSEGVRAGVTLMMELGDPEP